VGDPQPMKTSPQRLAAVREHLQRALRELDDLNLDSAELAGLKADIVDAHDRAGRMLAVEVAKPTAKEG